MRAQGRLINRLCRDLKPGRLEWIGLRHERKGHIAEPDSAVALQGLGLEGDHRVKKTPGSARQVTIISCEFIQQIEALMGIDSIHPGILRRNLLVSGINLNALRYQRFQIGEALFDATALCHPCARMETALGKGGVAAMLGYGGICAKVIQGGQLHLGDSVIKHDAPLEQAPTNRQKDLF